MLHFFRKIRRELLANNKTIKYLKYGVGEIILVVIGILIALQVNTWNEERIGAEKTKLLFQAVNDELVENIERMDRVIDMYIWKDSLYFKVINKKVEFEDYKESRDLLYSLPNNWLVMGFVEDDFNNLLAGKNVLTGSQDSIFSELRNLYGFSKVNIDGDEKIIHDIHLNFENKLMNEYSWYSSYTSNGTIDDEMIQFAVNDPYYLNYLSRLSRWEEIHLREMLWFRSEALSLHQRISDMLEMEKDTSLFKDIMDFQHIQGSYNIFNKDLEGSMEIQVGDEIKMTIRWSDSIGTHEANVYPYSDSHLIFHNTTSIGHGSMRCIIYGKDREVLGIYRIYDFLEEDGKRLMWRKID